MYARSLFKKYLTSIGSCSLKPERRPFHHTETQPAKQNPKKKQSGHECGEFAKLITQKSIIQSHQCFL
jgi:hypothetical protein